MKMAVMRSKESEKVELITFPGAVISLRSKRLKFCKIAVALSPLTKTKEVTLVSKAARRRIKMIKTMTLRFLKKLPRISYRQETAWQRKAILI